MTLKHIKLIRWAQRKCSKIKYLIKTDDDAIITVGKLIANLKNFKSEIKDHLHEDLAPKRSLDNRWFIPECIYLDKFLVNLFMEAHM